MALLHIVNQLRHEWQPALSCHVIHFNHKVRPESDEEVCLFYAWTPYDSCRRLVCARGRSSMNCRATF